MKALTRYAAPAAALLGLTVALAPAAGASTAKPGPGGPTTSVFHTTSTFTATSGCDRSTVTTSGLATITITTDQHQSVVTLADAEAGDGYTFTEGGTRTFWGRHPSYNLRVPGSWFNNTDPARSFQGLVKVTVTATLGTNVPTGFTATVDHTSCGL
jgi:hypothetical protein